MGMSVTVFFCCFVYFDSTIFIIVRRIHWLRSRAQTSRWKEEQQILTYEMQWTVRYFKHCSEKWELLHVAENITPGSRAYAHRQYVVWQDMAVKADKVFQLLTVDYISPLGLSCDK